MFFIYIYEIIFIKTNKFYLKLYFALNLFELFLLLIKKFKYFLKKLDYNLR